MKTLAIAVIITLSAVCTAQTLPVIISVNPNTANLKSGQTQQFTAEVINTTNTAVTWHSCVANAIDSMGLFTAPVVTSNQSICVYAISVADPSKNSTAYAMVSPAPPPPSTDANNTYCAPGNVVIGPATDGPASLPKTCLNTSLANTPSPGTVVKLAAGGKLQIAYDTLTCGQTLSLAHGANWTGTFNFTPKKCDNQHWITITSDGTLPPSGTRVSPATLPQMASITVRPGSSGANVTGDHIRFIGIAFLKQIGGQVSDMALTPGASFIIFDRVYAHGNVGEEARRFLYMSGNSIGVVDSWMDEFHCIAITGACTDSQAISGGAGNSPIGTWKIVNNYMSAAAETIEFGGAGGTVTPFDIEVRNNYMFKPMSWMPTSPNYVPPKYVVKNLFETKNSTRLLVEGNVMENVWGGFSQTGNAILLTPKNQSGKIGTPSLCPLCFVSDVTIRYNYVTTSCTAFQIANGASDNGGWSSGGHSYSIHDDVFDNLQYPGAFACAQTIGQLASEYRTANPPPTPEVMHDVALNHLTLITPLTWGTDPLAKSTTMMMIMAGPPATNASSTPQIKNLTYNNSIFASGRSGFYPTGGGTDNCSVPGPSPKKTLAQMITACWTGTSLFGGNIVVNYKGTSTWPAGNMFPASWNVVEMVNYNNGKGGNYALSSTSPYKNKALDGTDPGANIALVNKYTATARTGIPQ